MYVCTYMTYVCDLDVCLCLFVRLSVCLCGRRCLVVLTGFVGSETEEKRAAAEVKFKQLNEANEVLR
jgi:hypothetical protein